MWIVECEDQGVLWYEVYKNEPKTKTTYPTERTSCTNVINKKEAEYLGRIDKRILDVARICVYSEPTEIEFIEIEETGPNLKKLSMLLDDALSYETPERWKEKYKKYFNE